MKTFFFLDLENIHFGVAAHVSNYPKFTRIHPRVVNIQALKTLLDLQIGKGQGTVIADLSHMTNYMQDLAMIGWSVTQNSFGSGAKKNASDIAMTIQVMVAASKIRKPATFVLISGDGDFAPLVWYLRQQQHVVHVVSCQGSTAKVLDGVADSVIQVPATDLMLETHQAEPEIPKIELRAPPPGPAGLPKHPVPSMQGVPSTQYVSCANLFANPVWAGVVEDQLKEWEKTSAVLSASTFKVTLKSVMFSKAQVVLRETDVFNALETAGLLQVTETQRPKQPVLKQVTVVWSDESWQAFKDSCQVPENGFVGAASDLPNVDVHVPDKAWPNAMLDSAGWAQSLRGLLQQTTAPMRLWQFKDALTRQVCARHGALNYVGYLGRALGAAGLSEIEEMPAGGRQVHVRWSEDGWQEFVGQVEAARVRK